MDINEYVYIHDKYYNILENYGLIIKYDNDEENLKKNLMEKFNINYESKTLKSMISFYIVIHNIENIQDQFIQNYCNFIFSMKIEDEIFDILSKIEDEKDNLTELIKEKLLEPEEFNISEFLKFILKNLKNFEKHYVLLIEIFFDKVDEYYIELIEIWMKKLKNL